MRKAFLIISSLFLLNAAIAQEHSVRYWYVEPATRLADHIPFPIYESYPVYTADFRIGMLTNGEKAWQRFFNYPMVGMDFRFEHNTIKDFYDEESHANISLGNCYSLFGYCNGHIVKKGKWRLDYTWGGGLSYWPIWGNRLISSPVTAHLNLDVGPSFHIAEDWDVFARASFSHASNGAIMMPNKGINVLGAQIGCRYFPNGHPSEIHDTADSSFKKKNTVYAFEAAGFRESNTIYKRYCFGNTFEIGYSRLFHPCFSYGAGLDFLYTGENKIVYEYHDKLGEYATWNAFSMAPFVSFNLVYGRFVFLLAGAYYVYQPTQFVPRHYQKYYERLGFHYHFGTNGKAFTGVSMKVHASKIDYIEWTVGANLFEW